MDPYGDAFAKKNAETISRHESRGNSMQDLSMRKPTLQRDASFKTLDNAPVNGKKLQTI